MKQLWTPKSFTNWARIHKVTGQPPKLEIPNQINLVHDITRYGYTEESEISLRASLALTSPATFSFSGGNSGWNFQAHNFLYHLAFKISNGADADADARLCFCAEIPNTSGTSSTYIPLTEQFIIPKVTSEESYVGHTLNMPFLMQPHWWPAVFWNGALTTSTGTLYAVHIKSDE